MPIAGSDQPWVIDHESAMARLDELTGAVVVVDAVGFIEGVGIAELLAARADVTLTMPLAQPMLVDSETMVKALGRACRAGVTWMPNTVVGMVGDHEVTVFDTFSREATVLPADWVVVRTHGLPNDELYFGLQDEVGEVVRVGDAVAVRFVDRAIYDGHLAARSI
jgi:hypothetical protein